jgi:large subunit ribosomal protein L30
MYCSKRINKMAKVRVTQVRSAIDRPARQKATLIALGLGKINRAIEVELNPAISGMIQKVEHLVKIEEI